MFRRRGRKLGEILLSQGLVREDLLQEAMVAQNSSGKTLASTLVEMGAISKDDMGSILGEQIMLTSNKRLGEVLVDQGLITEEKLIKGLEHQKQKHLKIGESLVDLGYISEEKLIDVLSAQLDVQHVIVENIKVDPKLRALFAVDLCRQYKILPVYESNGVITIAMTDPSDLRVRDHIKFMTGKDIDAVIASEKKILAAIEIVYKGGGPSMDDLLNDASDDQTNVELVNDIEDDEELTEEEGQQVVKIVNFILHDAIAKGASDIHFEPSDNGYEVKYRTDGDLKVLQELPLHMRPQVISRVKIQSGMDIAEKRKPQDGRMKIRHENRSVDFRVSSFPAMTRKEMSEKIVLRIIDSEGNAFTLPQLGLSKETLETFGELIKLPDGVILVTGPTGSGKSSTLYAALKYVNDYHEGKECIITMEDPVESSVHGITQGQINPKAGFTFAAGMRAILRQDPDIIMIGEMRDLETCEMAVQAALTGHLVFSTLHTNDSPSAYTRLFDMGLAPYLVSSAVRGIMAQRLIRGLCKNCKEEYEPDPEVLSRVGLRQGIKLWRGKGCPKCDGTGFKGRLGLYELLIPDRNVEKLVIRKAEASEIKEYLVKRGDFIDLRRDGLIKAIKGLTTVDQVMAATQEGH